MILEHFANNFLLDIFHVDEQEIFVFESLLKAARISFRREMNSYYTNQRVCFNCFVDDQFYFTKVNLTDDEFNTCLNTLFLLFNDKQFRIKKISNFENIINIYIF